MISPGEGPLDTAGLQTLRSQLGSEEILTELVAIFGVETPERLGEMRLANEAGDSEAVRASVHQLRGGCLTLAALHMADLCSELETRAGDGSLEGAAGLVDEIELDFVRSRAALTALTSRRAP